MKLRLELIPGTGVLPIRLGETRIQIQQELEAIGLQILSTHSGLDYYFQNAVQIEFDDTDRTSFIGVSTHEDIELIYKGRNLFSMSAREVFDFVSKHEDDGHYEYSDIEYLFPKQIIALWDADEQYDYYHKQARPVWGQIGIGNASYLKDIT